MIGLVMQSSAVMNESHQGSDVSTGELVHCALWARGGGSPWGGGDKAMVDLSVHHYCWGHSSLESIRENKLWGVLN